MAKSWQAFAVKKQSSVVTSFNRPSRTSVLYLSMGCGRRSLDFTQQYCQLGGGETAQYVAKNNS